jgi:hypothetical protein
LQYKDQKQWNWYNATNSINESIEALKSSVEGSKEVMTSSAIIEDIADKTDSQEIFPVYLEKVFKRFGITFEDFEEYYKDPKCQLKGYLKYNPTTKKITLL